MKLENHMTPEDRLVEAICGVDQDDINSVENVLALMTEGEGDNPEVYMQMAGAALVRLRKALAEYKAAYPGSKSAFVESKKAREWDVFIDSSGNLRSDFEQARDMRRWPSIKVREVVD